MIEIKEPKIKDVVQGIHEALLRKAGRENRVNEDIVMENRLFGIICKDFTLGPRRCAELMNQTYSYDLSVDEVIQIFRIRRMANPVERRELFQWAEDVAAYFESAVSGQKEDFEKYEKKRKTPFQEGGRRHNSQDRLAAISIYEKYPELDLWDDKNTLYLLGNTLAKYFFYDISDVICEVYGFPQYRDSQKREDRDRLPEKKISYEQAMRRIQYLEGMLERSNMMLHDLQAEFEEQLEADKAKEMADFFARLNSEKYGCILDELLVVRKGVDELRRRNYELPIEINGLLIMVKKLIQFVRDSHIEPIMKIGSVRDVIASDVEFCNYEGTPFGTPAEEKKVRVISPGWMYKDKGLRISRPKVKEEEE